MATLSGLVLCQINNAELSADEKATDYRLRTTGFVQRRSTILWPVACNLQSLHYRFDEALEYLNKRMIRILLSTIPLVPFAGK
jgi:hypothetical protein